MQKIPLVWRWRLLLFSTPLLLLLSYEFNIKRTINLVADYNVAKRSFELSAKDFNAGKNNFQKGPKNYYDRSNTVPDSFFHFFTNYCDTNNVDIVGIGQTFFVRDSITIETNKINLSGTYENILKVLALIENERKINPLNAVTFELLNDKNNEKHSLSSVVYIKRLVHEK